ncbi:MAG: alginate export family protein [Planctomycetaceae bacterium]|nr:alginate export family protein [Planctomycetaceae bacterium]
MVKKRFSWAVLLSSLVLGTTGIPAEAGDGVVQADHSSSTSDIILTSCSDDDCVSCVDDGCTDGCCSSDVFKNCEKPFLPEIDPITFENCVWKGRVGASIRYRYLHENNRLRPGGPGLSSYDQWRFNPFAEVTWNESVTGYVEAIDATTFGEELPILAIDENRADLLQYYVDVKVAELENGDVHARYGRQMLNYGDQHVMSPLAWGNTFRNFEGFKAYYKGKDWDIDAFAVQPVNGAARGVVVNTKSFDTPDQSEWVSGVYATYRGLEQGTLDLFWIWDIENEPVANRQDGDRHTFGARYYGTKAVKGTGDEVERTWGYDVQGAIQIGNDDFTGGPGTGPNLNVYSGFFNALLSHTWNKVDMKPQVFALYYLGTGDQDPTDTNNNTYFSLYPLGHAYWGILDNLGGQNMVDYSVGAKVNPKEKLTLMSQWHWFDQHRSQDFIYNIAGAPLGTPAATQDSHIGNELDLVATYKVNSNLTLESGYSWFWYGNAVQQGGLNRGDATQFYFLANYSF